MTERRTLLGAIFDRQEAARSASTEPRPIEPITKVRGETTRFTDTRTRGESPLPPKTETRGESATRWS
jgi:hypothetical protein